MDRKILLLGKQDNFSKHISLCLKEDMLDVDTSHVFNEQKYDTVIVNLLHFNESLERQIQNVLKSNVNKIVLLENALDLYLNSKNTLPFSVYTKLVPRNETCERFLEIERRIIESKKSYVIFRISETYGLSSPKSIVEKLLFSHTGEFENSSHDFIYDGDVISAIEVSLRKEVVGLFDIASGQSIELKELVELIKNIRRSAFNIRWKRKKLVIEFNCDNFKYYKWQPLVDIEMGLKTLFLLRRRDNGLL
jgi:nucleoside-diphosphate-sugar epimerase